MKLSICLFVFCWMLFASTVEAGEITGADGTTRVLPTAPVVCEPLTDVACQVADNVLSIKKFSLSLLEYTDALYDSYFLPTAYRGIYSGVLLTGALSRWTEIPLVALPAPPSAYIGDGVNFMFTRHYESADGKRKFRAVISFAEE